MTDCATGNGVYRDLSIDQRIESGKRLIRRIKQRSVFGMGVVVAPQEYRAIMAEVDAPSCYTTCLRLSATKISEMAEQIRFDGKIAYFFESGHVDAQEADRHMDTIAKNEALTRQFRYHSHTFVNKEEALPLQAADMLAWQLSHRFERVLDGYERARADFIALTRPKDKLMILTTNHLRALRELFATYGPTFLINDLQGIEALNRVFRKHGLLPGA